VAYHRATHHKEKKENKGDRNKEESKEERKCRLFESRSNPSRTEQEIRSNSGEKGIRRIIVVKGTNQAERGEGKGVK